MKIVQIGAAGHYAYALPTAKKYGLAFEGLCAADPEDDLDRAQRELSAYGFAPRIYRDWREMLLATAPGYRGCQHGDGEKFRDCRLCAGTWHKRVLREARGDGYGGACKTGGCLSNSVLHYKNKKNICFCGMFGIDYRLILKQHTAL